MGGEQSRAGTQKEEEEKEEGGGAPAKSGEPESAAEGKRLKVWKKVQTEATLGVSALTVKLSRCHTVQHHMTSGPHDHQQLTATPSKHVACSHQIHHLPRQQVGRGLKSSHLNRFQPGRI